MEICCPGQVSATDAEPVASPTLLGNSPLGVATRQVLPPLVDSTTAAIVPVGQAAQSVGLPSAAAVTLPPRVGVQGSARLWKVAALSAEYKRTRGGSFPLRRYRFGPFTANCAP